MLLCQLLKNECEMALAATIPGLLIEMMYQ